MTVETTGDVPGFSIDTIYRFACHFFLSLIPGAALPEVYDAIRDAYVYHVVTAPQVSGLLELPTHSAVSARVNRSYERPGFGVAEE
jgi:hypothetical protein